MNNMASKVAGNIDTIDETMISGWYINGSDNSPSLRFYADGILLTEAIADGERSDVKEFGYSTSQCGFHARIPVSNRPPLLIEIVDSELGNILWTINFEEKRVVKNVMADASSFESNEINQLRGNEVTTDLRLLFDVSDLVYYLGHHDNLTGIQRVQSSVIQAIFRDNLLPKNRVDFICFDSVQKKFRVIDQRSFVALLIDLSLAVEDRQINYDRMKARSGILFVGSDLKLSSSDREKTVISLLGAAWVIPDYVRTILNIKRKFGVRFVPTFHDLIPIYAKETCDQGTAEVFKAFLDQIIRHVDVGLCVSENTATDLRRYCEENNHPLPPTHVTKNGSSLSEFFAIKEEDPMCIEDAIPTEPYALFVSTVEGRKNHIYAFQIWQNLVKLGVKMPKLICVGRLGWRAEEFLQSLMRTNNLNGLIEIVEDISDAELEALYRNCQFTIYPSIYEGWGLPVGESLAYGKPCVLAQGSSLPEVAGDLGIYIPIDNITDACRIVRELVESSEKLEEWTNRVVNEYKPVRWSDVAKEVIVGCRMALNQPSKYLYPEINLGNEYLFRQLRVETHGRMGQGMLQSLLEANQRVILKGHASQNDKISGLECRSGSWFAPESWGCWSDGLAANLLLSLKNLDDNVENICLYLSFQVPGQYLPCSIALKINGVLIGAVQPIKAAAEIKRWEIPTKLLLQKIVNKRIDGILIDLEFSLSNISPSGIEKLISVDSRKLGLGIRSLMITDEADLATRCAVLEKLIFEKAS
jgi:glycosyltransferase involved in cell wall biosynthesis